MQAAPSDTSVPVLLNGLAFDGVGPERTRVAYTPNNYRRLIVLENKYDPQNIFRFSDISPSP